MQCDSRPSPAQSSPWPRSPPRKPHPRSRRGGRPVRRRGPEARGGRAPYQEVFRSGGQGIEAFSDLVDRRFDAWKASAEADPGDPAAQYLHGLCFLVGLRAERDPAEGTSWLRKAAGHGYAPAQSELGNCCRFGLGVGEGAEEAARWYEKAAEQGNANAQANLGRLYERGIGVKKDRDAALAWYRKAAAQGLSEAEKALRRLEGR